ncbi:MAG: helix-turn-helix transcriptional regulator [Nitrospirae bacterium]|nr:helix-turn-helix transcriptional regulator [Nitrospirota bacterium]
MSLTGWYSEKLEQCEENIDFLTDSLIIDINEQLVSQMIAQGLKRSDLAKKMNVSKSYITKCLRGNVNFTVKTLAGFAKALNCDISMDIKLKDNTRLLSKKACNS